MLSEPLDLLYSRKERRPRLIEKGHVGLHAMKNVGDQHRILQRDAVPLQCASELDFDASPKDIFVEKEYCKEFV